jgi:alkanesulfonate monooxygenase
MPIHDPLALVPAMAGATEHLGFGVTVNLSYELPFLHARRMSTLDHLSAGRIGWNIVTGYLDSAARAAGRQSQVAHDLRYEIADEYMDIVYALWEGSWEDDAIVKCSASGMYADPKKVHLIRHMGKHFNVEAVHLCEPSPQRTPVLFQAGASPAGAAFGGKHAECVFITSATKSWAARSVARTREQSALQGRAADSLAVLLMFTAICGETDQEAQNKYNHYQRLVSTEGALTLISGWSGIDFSKYSPNEHIRNIENDSVRSFVGRFTGGENSKVWTIEELAEFVAIGGASPVIVGSAATVADELQSWAEETDVDGFTLTGITVPDTFIDFIRIAVPELQRRGVFKTDYIPGTLRHKLFGKGPRLQSPHRGSYFRRKPS